LHALRCGAPPHGGIALGNDVIFYYLLVMGLIEYGWELGFDRLMAMLCNAQSIRDVIAFPKTSNGVDLLFKSPAAVDNEMLYQYGIRPR
jgi:aspartyl-tRNA synthetase